MNRKIVLFEGFYAVKTTTVSFNSEFTIQFVPSSLYSKPAPSWADRMEQDEASKISPGKLQRCSVVHH